MTSYDIKIVIRPRDGFNVSKLGDAQIPESIRQITGIATEQAEEDIHRSCADNNVIVVSTPIMSNAEKYCRIRGIQIGALCYAATAYATTPKDTAKGVIHNIPSYDTEQDITKSLVYKKNPTILQARGMGNKNSVLIVFDGRQVPYHVYYRGAEYKCYLHKKHIEVCDICSTVGHRAVVCPTPTRKKCKGCDTVNPPAGHTSHPCCALCGNDHTTGDKACHRRFQTPHLLLQRRRERLRLEQEGANQETRPSTSARSPALDSIPNLKHSLYADITLWVTGGSDGDIQDMLQQAINEVVAYVAPRGLGCSPQRSELLLYKPTWGVWADLVRPKSGANTGAVPAPPNDPPPEQARDAEVIRLRKENDDLKNTINRLVNEMAEIKKLVSNASGNDAAVRASETPIPAPVDGTATSSKRRAIVNQTCESGVLSAEVSEIKQTLTALADSLKQVAPSVTFLTDSVRQIQVALGDPKRGLGALADRIDAIEARMASSATVVQPLLREARLHGVSHQRSDRRSHSLRSPNCPGDHPTGPRREKRQRFVPFVAPLQPQVTDDDLPPREYTVLYRPVDRRSHFLAASGDAIAAFLSGVPGAHRVRPNLRRNVVAVDTLPGEDLTALLAVRVICDVRVRAKALILNTCTGTLFDVDPTFDGATIFEGLESSVPVVAIARSGDVVTLRFAGDVVPEEVLLFRRRRAVRPRLPRPLQCGRCGLFGHATVTCSRDPRCLQCAGRHPTNSCTVDRRRCLHCGGPHAATEPRCPQWQLERRVAATLASSKPRITRKQALELARSSGAAVIDSSKQRPAGQRATESRPLSSRRQPGLSYSAALTGGTHADSSISGGVGEPPVTDNNPVQPPGATAPVTSVLVLTALASALRSLLELAPADSPARHMCVAALAMHDALVQHG
ncbi:hypothetical protein HPB49_005986 [Dermacentor silvarum]|uniref:Uncharacterized protein n=1 Tax=Dermacentor silvarum TaxID=543639 RepID=A0ACB8C2A7_DERSI|nr:hypothetical protein HPB49_005986 [Dermacentor silvarum]